MRCFSRASALSPPTIDQRCQGQDPRPASIAHTLVSERYSLSLAAFNLAIRPAQAFISLDSVDNRLELRLFI